MLTVSGDWTCCHPKFSFILYTFESSHPYGGSVPKSLGDFQEFVLFCPTVFLPRGAAPAKEKRLAQQWPISGHGLWLQAVYGLVGRYRGALKVIIWKCHWCSVPCNIPYPGINIVKIWSICLYIFLVVIAPPLLQVSLIYANIIYIVAMVRFFGRPSWSIGPLGIDNLLYTELQGPMNQMIKAIVCIDSKMINFIVRCCPGSWTWGPSTTLTP